MPNPVAAALVATLGALALLQGGLLLRAAKAASVKRWAGGILLYADQGAKRRKQARWFGFWGVIVGLFLLAMAVRLLGDALLPMPNGLFYVPWLVGAGMLLLPFAGWVDLQLARWLPLRRQRRRIDLVGWVMVATGFLAAIVEPWL